MGLSSHPSYLARMVVVTGDPNANCSWAPRLPLVARALCDVVHPIFSRHRLRRLAPFVEAPMWVSPQGFTGALDHVFIRPRKRCPHRGCIPQAFRDTISPSPPPFPPFPLPLSILLPATRHPRQTATISASKKNVSLCSPVPKGADQFVEVSSALKEVAAATYGPPQAARHMPAAVWGHVLHLQEYVTARPAWPHHSRFQFERRGTSSRWSKTSG